MIKRAETDKAIRLGCSVFNRVAECYEQQANNIDANGDQGKKSSLLQAALDNHRKAFPLNKGNYTRARGAVRILQRLASFEEPSEDAHQGDEQPTDPGALTTSECQKQIMGVLQSLDECVVNDTTQFVKCLVETISEGPKFFRAINSAAAGQQQLSWLQEKYRKALAYTEKHMLSVSSAHLALNLASLYAFHAGDEDRGMQIWEAVAKAKIQTTAIANAESPPQLQALDCIADYCFCKALKDRKDADHYVTKMEQMFSKYCLSYSENAKTVETELPHLLATWYHQTGRKEDALRIVTPYFKYGLTILSDDDPANHHDAYTFLIRALVAMGDYPNLVAIFIASRPYRNGKAVIPSQNGMASDHTSVTGRGEDDDTYDTDMCGGWSCYGNCDAAGEIYDGVYICPYEGLMFCGNVSQRCGRLALRPE